MKSSEGSKKGLVAQHLWPGTAGEVGGHSGGCRGAAQEAPGHYARSSAGHNMGSKPR